AIGIGCSLLATPALGKKSKPTPCASGRFLNRGAHILPGDAGANEAIVLNGSRIALGEGGPLTPRRVKAHNAFTSVTARWRACAGLTGPATLRARIAAPGCSVLSGSFRAKKSGIQKSVTATRSTCGDGVFDPELPGEQCDAMVGCPANQECTKAC